MRFLIFQPGEMVFCLVTSSIGNYQINQEWNISFQNVAHIIPISLRDYLTASNNENQLNFLQASNMKKWELN